MAKHTKKVAAGGSGKKRKQRKQRVAAGGNGKKRKRAKVA